MTTKRLLLITYQTQILRETPQHTSLGVGMVKIVENQNDTFKIGLGYLNSAKKHSEDSLT